jgi:chaperonin cofactor prefoldin
MKPVTYIVGTLVAVSISLGAVSKYLYDRNSELKAEVSQLEAERQKAQENLKLVAEQLAREHETRKVAQAALLELRSVPDVDYSTPLPRSVGNVLDAFHRSIDERMQ